MAEPLEILETGLIHTKVLAAKPLQTCSDLFVVGLATHGYPLIVEPQERRILQSASRASEMPKGNPSAIQ